MSPPPSKAHELSIEGYEFQNTSSFLQDRQTGLQRPVKALKKIVGADGWELGTVGPKVLHSKDIYDRGLNCCNKTQGTRSSIESQGHSPKCMNHAANTHDTCMIHCGAYTRYNHRS